MDQLVTWMNHEGAKCRSAETVHPNGVERSGGVFYHEPGGGQITCVTLCNVDFNIWAAAAAGVGPPEKQERHLNMKETTTITIRPERRDIAKTVQQSAKSAKLHKLIYRHKSCEMLLPECSGERRKKSDNYVRDEEMSLLNFTLGCTGRLSDGVSKMFESKHQTGFTPRSRCGRTS